MEKTKLTAVVQDLEKFVRDLGQACLNQRTHFQKLAGHSEENAEVASMRSLRATPFYPEELARLREQLHLLSVVYTTPVITEARQNLVEGAQIEKYIALVDATLIDQINSLCRYFDDGLLKYKSFEALHALMSLLGGPCSNGDTLHGLFRCYEFEMYSLLCRLRGACGIPVSEDQVDTNEAVELGSTKENSMNTHLAELTAREQALFHYYTSQCGEYRGEEPDESSLTKLHTIFGKYFGKTTQEVRKHYRLVHFDRDYRLEYLPSLQRVKTALTKTRPRPNGALDLIERDLARE